MSKRNLADLMSIITGHTIFYIFIYIYSDTLLPACLLGEQCNYRTSLPLEQVGSLFLHFILSLCCCSRKNSTENFTPLSHKAPSMIFPSCYFSLSKKQQLVPLSADKKAGQEGAETSSSQCKLSTFHMESTQ